MTFEKRMKDALVLLEDGEFSSAIDLASELIIERPTEADPIIVAAVSLYKVGKPGLAAMMYEAALQRAPDRAHVYSNLACCIVQNHPEEALRLLRKGLDYDQKAPTLLANMCSAHLALGHYAEALEWARKCLEVDPGNRDATYNSSLALLGQGAWRKGWQRYDVSLGNRHRKELFFNPNERRWSPDMKGVGTLVVYPEQGLGDEILFASMFEHLRDADRKELIIQCDPRLEGLFKRSFPWATVSGTRDREWCDWYERVDAKLEMGGLGSYFAPNVFRKEKFLEADPCRRTMWRALFNGMGKKPKIGLAWSGGNADTGARKRSIPVEQLTPLVMGVDADFFSLEYRGEGCPPAIHDLRYGTRTRDYDDTAAMVSELDLIVSVTTTVVDLCGALGKECWALAPSIPPWRYGFSGDKMHFYDSVKVFRQKDGEEWAPVIDRVTKALKERFE